MRYALSPETICCWSASAAPGPSSQRACSAVSAVGEPNSPYGWSNAAPGSELDANPAPLEYVYRYEGTGTPPTDVGNAAGVKRTSACGTIVARRDLMNAPRSSTSGKAKRSASNSAGVAAPSARVVRETPLAAPSRSTRSPTSSSATASACALAAPRATRA